MAPTRSPSASRSTRATTPSSTRGSSRPPSALTEALGIQRQIPDAYHGRPLKRLIAGGADVVGIVGHRDVTAYRGAGDPGDAIFERLATAGYEAWDFDARVDLTTWRLRQRKLNADRGAGLRVDGVPGPATARALAEAGYPAGLWIRRP
jgi:hypothetical protein